MVVLTEIPQGHEYDVFLSFRGTDTRNNFTDHLHKALLDANIDTFLDDAEIQTGEDLKPELENAIKSSRASVIVLSENYATSTWCLDELALILEQRRTCKHIVIPIFYHVKPTDVRKQQGSFGDAMRQHKNKMEAETDAERKSQRAQKMEKWEKALVEVADLKGVEANGTRKETILIEGIIKEISGRLDLHKRSEIPHIIGLESSIREITSFLKDESYQNTEILTIWGMAGIGKTYLANYVFQLHYQHFERSCFLEDIERKCIQPDGLLDLQKRLLKDIRDGSWMEVRSTDVGTSRIEKMLLRKRTLLVLDGIDKYEQLDMLLGTKGLHRGSKVIVTSKSELLTEKCRLFETRVPPNHKMHFLNGLSEKESLQLLSWHAFGRNEPKEDDIKESMRVVRYCQGHPLALKVLGSCVRSEDATWEDILESLGKNDIYPDIQKVLKISFNSLPSDNDRDMFKYIACFFVGEDREFTEEILKSCKICKSSGIKILINRCLLKVRSTNELEMHQLLQDMGRDIVHQEYPKKPWKRSLLWRHEECVDVLQKTQGTVLIRGFVLDMKPCNNGTSCESYETNMRKFKFRSLRSLNWVYILLSLIWWLYGWVSRIFHYSFHNSKGGFETLAFSKMCDLRLLRLNYVQLNGSYKDFPAGLRWMCMHGFPLSYIPSDLQMKDIVALDLSNSKLQRLWKKPMLLGSLKFLNLSNCCELVTVDHLSGFPLLKRLILAGCTSLVQVCESIGNHCDRLEMFDTSGCNKLRKLPRSIGKLKRLRILLLDGCSVHAEFPYEIKEMKSLEVLHAHNIRIESGHRSPSAIVIPRSLKTVLFSLPRSLVRLSLINNNLSNESFPKDFSSLSMLDILDLSENPIDFLPDCVRSLSRLNSLGLHKCCRLKTVLSVPNTITDLSTHHCPSLERITFYPERSAPRDVTYFDNDSLKEIQDMFKLENLAQIDEEILYSLGWTNKDYLSYYKISIADDSGYYHYTGKIVPTQMLYERGIFSTYIKGHEVPKWFTQRSNGNIFTLESSPNSCRICGLNVCVVSAISNPTEVGPSRIEIRNLTKNCSWTYQPMIFAHPEDHEFEDVDDVEVWLSHWMFRNNEFEDGDEVCIYFSKKFKYIHKEDYVIYGGDGPDYGNVREYGISLVYDDGNKKEDPLAYYKSWNHILGRDLSVAEVSSGHYLLKQRSFWGEYLSTRIISD
uniref:disease resistance protein RPV1-like n=1 Tax=Erigeron canadensis TaxID=72917 RepID=UPI001CB93B11|nr:disease resistance protein RPV1-like [Erigeron canadensis]